ncbi:MAG: RloB family protein [Archangium sp.]
MFVVATEDTYAPKQYFAAFELPRVSIKVVETDDSQSAASHVVARLKKIVDEAKKFGEWTDVDQYWVLLDTDHWSQGTHVAAFSKAIKEAKDCGFHVAVSNPCFELWLLLHVVDASSPLDAKTAEQQLRTALGGYSKTNVPTAKLMPLLNDAIARAKKLDVGEGGWPQSVGTQVHLLVEAIHGSFHE